MFESRADIQTDDLGDVVALFHGEFLADLANVQIPFRRLRRDIDNHQMKLSGPSIGDYRVYLWQMTGEINKIVLEFQKVREVAFRDSWTRQLKTYIDRI